MGEAARADFNTDDAKKALDYVARVKATARGLFDIHGNMGEWCHDWFDEHRAEPAVEDPTGPEEGWYRVFRGSGCDFDRASCRTANRESNQPPNRSGFLTAVTKFGSFHALTITVRFTRTALASSRICCNSGRKYPCRFCS
jgi:formylglycine-generating enzyme required for sulfatase activity